MKLKNFWNLLRGKTKAIKPANLSLSNIKAVIQAYFRKAKLISGFSLPSHIYEQIIWRRTQVMETSPECWRDGTCKVCGCEILGKTMEDRGCEASKVMLPECYPDMMDEITWKLYKKNHDIKLFD